MTDEVKPDPKEATTQEAQLAAENMASGVEETPAVDFNADYEAAQQFSVSDVDRTGGGAAAAEATTAPHFQVSQPQETETAAQATGNPSDYLDMAEDVAEDVGSQTEAGTGNVDDDLIDKALDMGKPGSSTQMPFC